MSFLTELKTKMSLDNSDWKKTLESVKQIENTYVKEAGQNYRKLDELKSELDKKKLEQSKNIEKINEQIARLEKQRQIEILNGDKKSLREIEKKLTLTKKLRTSQKEVAAITEKAIAEEISGLKRIQSAQADGMKYVYIRKQAALEQKKIYEDQIKTIDKKTKSTKSLANQTIRYLRWAGTIAGAAYAAKRAWGATIAVGIRVNRMMEDNTSGIAALVSANTQMVLSNGQAVTSYEKFAMGQKIAKRTMEDLRKASVKTYATFPQLTEIFQQAIGKTLSMGDAFGTSVDSITKNTITLAQRMSNIAGSIGMPMDRVREEIRSILGANASTDSMIATMLFGSPGEANKAIRMAEQRGENGVKDMLDSMMKPFDALGEVDSYTRSLLELENAWDSLMQKMSEPIFSGLKEAYGWIADILNKINQDKESVGVSGLKVKDIENMDMVELEERRLEVAEKIRDTLKETTKLRLDANEVTYFESSWMSRDEKTGKTEEQRDIEKWKAKDLELKQLSEIQNEILRITELKNKEKEKTQQKIDLMKDEVRLQTKLAIDTKLMEKRLKENNKSIEKTKAIEKEILENNYKIEKTKRALSDTEKFDMEERKKGLKYIAILEENNKNKQIEIAKIKLEEQQKITKAQEELWVAQQKNMGENVSKIDISTWRLKALGEQLQIEDNKIEKLRLQKQIEEEIYKINIEQNKNKKWGKGQDQFIGLFDENADFNKKVNIKPITLEVKLKGFDKASKALAGVGNGMIDLVNINNKYKKIVEEIETKKSTGIETEKALGEASYKNTEATLGAYANMTGAMAGFYDEDDRRKKAQLDLEKAILAAKLALQIKSAIAQSGSMTGIPGVIAMVSLLGSLGVMAMGSGGSQGAISEKDQAINVAESETELILDRLDRQIELLEQLNKAGTAGAARVEYSKLSYEDDVLKISNDIATDFTRNTGPTSGLYRDTKNTHKTKYNELLNELGFDIFKSADEWGYRVRADEVAGDSEKTIDFLVYFNENRDVFNSLMSNMEDDLNGWINTAQEAIADYTTATLESLSELTDASKKFKEISDSITMTDFYASRDLEKANSDVNKIIAENGAKDLNDYLNNYISEIDKLNEYFTDETYDLLMSQNLNDLSEQTEKVNELNEILGTTYITTAEDALNYIDSIELVGEALATSNENIKTWGDSFKTDYELAEDLAKKFNVELATSYSELDELFLSLKGGIEGLSDAELELLDANKALIEGSNEALNEAFLGEYSPLDQRQKADYAAMVASSPEDYSISAIDASYMALQESARVATRDEDIVTQFNDYTALLLDQQEEDATRTDIVNEIRANNETLNDIVDRLERVEEANATL